MKTDKEIAELSHEDIERWMEQKRIELGLQCFYVNAWNVSGPDWTAHMKHDLVMNKTWQEVEAFVAQYDPEQARLKKLAELKAEVAKLEKGGES